MSEGAGSSDHRQIGATARPGTGVDLLLAYMPTTMGFAKTHEQLVTALTELGVSVVSVHAPEHWGSRLKFAYPLIDLVEAFAYHRSVERAVRRWQPRAFMYESGLSILFEPESRLNRAAVRFDAAAAMNRPGLRNWGQRRLQARRFRRARLLLPATSPATDWAESELGVDRPTTLFSPLDASPRGASPREGAVRWGALCYAADPDKKGLDLIVSAWSQTNLEEPLYVAGLAESEADAFLRARGIKPPPGVICLGKLTSADYRSRSTTVKVHIAAPRLDQYAATQLEALLDGALLACAIPARGTYEALRICRRLEPLLVAETRTADALASVIQAAFALDEEACVAYREHAQGLLSPYTWAAFRERLANEVLPTLLH